MPVRVDPRARPLGDVVYTAPSDSDGDFWGAGGGGGGGTDTVVDPNATVNASARAQAQAQNDATRALVDAQHKLLAGFGTSRDTKLSNIQRVLEAGQALLLRNWGSAMSGLEGSELDNEKAQADASFSNISNAVRERASILDQAASLGAGETDLLKAQLQALRNYGANQGEVNRSFFDTLRSVNNAKRSLNSDTASGRINLFNQAEADRESAWANYYNQVADTWTQIANIENANTNTDSASSVAYQKQYTQAGDEAARAVGSAYTRQNAPEDLGRFDGRGPRERRLTSSNRAASVNLGGPQKRPEGATLRRWN
jgi:hypothetical protein